MYTSFGKVNDRFGFSTSGKFRCAYKNTRSIVIGGMTAIGVLIVLIIISVTFVAVNIGDFSSLFSEALWDIIFKPVGGSEAGKSIANLGFTISGIAFGIILLVIAIIVFLIIVATMRTGQEYSFRADEEKFIITYPEKMHRVVKLNYEDVTGVTYEEWSFIFAPKCFDITVKTKGGDLYFRFIHTGISKANGIRETPFNIIRERIGLVNEDEYHYIDKSAAEQKKTKFR